MAKTTVHKGGAVADTWIEYELRFLRGFDSVRANSGTIEVEVRSPLLDRMLHPRGIVKVSLDSHAVNDGAKHPDFVVDGFQIASIEAYLRQQRLVRRTIEAELGADKSAEARGSVWRNAKLLALIVRPRLTISRRELATVKKNHQDIDAEEIEKEFDQLDTRSSFIVAIRATSQDEHIYNYRFRDDAFVDMQSA